MEAIVTFSFVFYRIDPISKCKSQWVEAVLQKHNILYVQPEYEVRR